DERKVTMNGGNLGGDWSALSGDVAKGNASEIFVDKAFVGVDGIHAEHGLTTNCPDQAAIHRAMMRQARQRIVVADHRKIGVVGYPLLLPASAFHTLGADKAPPQKAIQA